MWGWSVTKPLLIEHDDGVDRVTLNRPESLNALDPDMIDALNGYFEGLQRNRTTRVVVLKGAGASFCAGLDLKHAMARRAGQQEPPGVTESLDSQRRIADIVMLMRRCPQPIIALVQGAAAGGGFALALAADIRIATRSARMNCAFIKLGLGGCDIGTSYFLPRLVGVSVASELILTGRFIHAERALAVGLVSEVVEERRARCRRGALCRCDDDGVAGRFAAVEGMPQHERRCRLDRGGDRDGRPQSGAVQPLGRFQRGHQGLSRKAKACLYQAIRKRSAKAEFRETQYEWECRRGADQSRPFARSNGWSATSRSSGGPTASSS